jgi:hypothetical protein
MIFFKKKKIMAWLCLLIFFSEALKATAIWRLHLPQVAGWLWQNLQADKQKQKKFVLLI